MAELANVSTVFRKSLGMVAIGFVTIGLTSCGTYDSASELKPKSAEEQDKIHNSWYPVKSKECQLIVDSFSLVSAAIGSASDENLLNNMDQINENLESAGKTTSTALLNLANTTSEPSIKNWALRAVPIFASVGSMVSTSQSSGAKEMLSYFEGLSKLVEDVPDACRS